MTTDELWLLNRLVHGPIFASNGFAKDYGWLKKAGLVKVYNVAGVSKKIELTRDGLISLGVTSLNVFEAVAKCNKYIKNNDITVSLMGDIHTAFMVIFDREIYLDYKKNEMFLEV